VVCDLHQQVVEKNGAEEAGKDDHIVVV